jgi:signal transduction histidine kinase
MNFLLNTKEPRSLQHHYSPLMFLAKISLSVFCAETLIMLLFLVLPQLPSLIETLVDSTLLSVLIAPALYFFAYRPLLQEIVERSQIEIELRHSQALLEQKTQQLEATLKKLQQAPQLLQTEKMSSLGRLVAGTAHEINNPINFIYGNFIHIQDYVNKLVKLVELYQTHYSHPVVEIQDWEEEIELEFLKQDLAKILNSMKVGTDRIRNIVLSLQNFTRVDEADLKKVNIHEGLESALVILQHRLKPKSGAPIIQLVKNYSSLPPVECFPGQLNQVFMNILANAIDALEESHHIQIDTTQKDDLKQDHPKQIVIRTSVLNGCWVEIAIADNGPGMSKQVQKQIFHPFFTTKPVGKGTGLGLAISYQIIKERHGGQLTCSSTPGQGTEFVIQIPIRQTP